MTFEQAWAAFIAAQDHSDRDKRVARLFWKSALESVRPDDQKKEDQQRRQCAAFDSKSVAS